MATPNNGGGEVTGRVVGAVAARDIDDEILRSIGASGDAFADAEALIRELTGTVQDITEVAGTGFALLPSDQKSRLVGTKFAILDTRFTDTGDYGRFCSLVVVTGDGGRYIVNDGSTGICAQMYDLYERNGRAPFRGIAPRGLRESSYATCVSCGKPRTQFEETCRNTLDNGSVCGNTDTKRGTGSTFYVDLSADLSN